MSTERLSLLLSIQDWCFFGFLGLKAVLWLETEELVLEQDTKKNGIPDITTIHRIPKSPREISGLSVHQYWLSLNSSWLDWHKSFRQNMGFPKTVIYKCPRDISFEILHHVTRVCASKIFLLIGLICLPLACSNQSLSSLPLQRLWKKRDNSKEW